jgi:signal transduction histidine kinase
MTPTTSAGASALVVVMPGPRGAVAALLYADDAALRLAPLARLIALYTGLLASALLVFLYVVLTRIVVGPIDALRIAAGRVAEGARELGAPRRGGRELIELGSSLAAMTAALRAEERALRDNITELEQTTRDLKRAQETLVRSERLASVGRLAAGLAHEIGNPIAAILSLEELLLDGPLGAEEREFVVRMKRETERVHRVLRELLDFARPAARPHDGAPLDQLASVREAIDQVAALVRPQKAFQGVELTLAVEDGLPPVAMASAQVEQMLLNLLLNAADAVPHPGGRVTIAAARQGDRLRIAIEDNGGGVLPEIRQRLFEPFVSTKEVGKGTGLGLAVCRGLAEAAGGTLALEDGVEGARFVLELPRAEAPAPPPA